MYHHTQGDCSLTRSSFLPVCSLDIRPAASPIPKSLCLQNLRKLKPAGCSGLVEVTWAPWDFLHEKGTATGYVPQVWTDVFWVCLWISCLLFVDGKAHDWHGSISAFFFLSGTNWGKVTSYLSGCQAEAKLIKPIQGFRSALWLRVSRMHCRTYSQKSFSWVSD